MELSLMLSCIAEWLATIVVFGDSVAKYAVAPTAIKHRQAAAAMAAR